MISAKDLSLLEQALPTMSESERRRNLDLLTKYKAELVKEAGGKTFLEFIKHVYPDYKVGAHHAKLAKLFEEIAEGKRKRVIVNIAPRHGKSELISYLAPAWFLGKHPAKKVIMASHTADLAVNFGRRVRNLVGSDAYKDIFPKVELQADSKSASRWGTNYNGEYFAIGVGGALAGRGADLFIIDDPHSEQDAKIGKADVFLPAWEWFQSGPLQRLMPGGAIIVVMTRWSKLDLTGQIVNQMVKNEDVDDWEVVEFPAILEVESEVPDPANRLLTIHKTIEKPLWPEFFNLDALYRTKASMPVFQWNAQYQQQPTAEEAAMVKREWWKEWPNEEPPTCEYIIMTLDAAAEKNNRADFTALTTWGVFFHEEENCYCIILLNSIKKRLEFPELKELAMEQYEEWEPDAFIVEKKSSGTPLYQEMRRSGLMVQEYTPHRGSGDKTARLNSVADIVRSGLVYVPQTRWAEELVEEVAGFPFMSHDDLVDTTIMALMRFRQGGFISLPTDEAESESLYRRRGGFY